MKAEEIQEFRSSGILTLVGLVGLSALIILTPWNRQGADPRSDEALQKAEVVGYQVIQIYREASSQNEMFFSKEQARGPASADSSDGLRVTGTMGMDPWGRPYHYRILPSKDAQKTRILVWSSGPNLRAESSHLEDEHKPIDSAPGYTGDDLGVVLSVTQN